MMEGKPELNLTVVETYEEYIDASRESFQKVALEEGEVSMDSVLHFMDELNMRL